MWTDKAHAGNKFHVGKPIFAAPKNNAHRPGKTGPMRLEHGFGECALDRWLPVF
jgi:hypothetical protein